MPNAVYDPDTEGDQKYHPPNLDPLDNKPAGDPSDPRTIHKNQDGQQNNGSEPRSDLRDAEKTGDNFYNPHDEEDANGKSSTASALAGAESGFDHNKNEPGSGFKFNEEDSSDNGLRKTLKAISKHKKGVGIGIGAGGGLASIALMVFFIMIPLKIEHIVQNLEHHFFATSEDAVQKESDRMLQRYLISHVFPTFKDGNCGSTIDRHCKVNITGKGPISNLYRTWANDRLETKLAEKYGIEFKYHKSSNTWYLKAPGTVTPDSPDGDNIGKDGAGLETDFRRSNRQEVLS
ncbi:MAG TPA: hypothetical protein VHA05_03320, partial [Candidatus Saccharimonadales bacterium]|nr:hypothetical protein [Candidatus Saccharimonadales bacterium]